MEIVFKRSGGFAGITLRAQVDTGSLPPQDAQRLHTLVEQSNFFSLSTATSSSGVDRYQYTLTVVDGKRQNTATVTDAQLSEALEELINYMTAVAKNAASK